MAAAAALVGVLGLLVAGCGGMSERGQLSGLLKPLVTDVEQAMAAVDARNFAGAATSLALAQARTTDIDDWFEKHDVFVTKHEASDPDFRCIGHQLGEVAGFLEEARANGGGETSDLHVGLREARDCFRANT